MQWDDTVNAGFNRGAAPWQCMNEDYRQINVKNDLASGRSIYRFYQRLLAFRRESPVILSGSAQEYLPRHRQLMAYARELNGKRFLIVGNLSPREATLRLPDDFSAYRLTVRLTNQTRAQVRSEMRLKPYEAMVLEEK